jgi:hypothetical protein
MLGWPRAVPSVAAADAVEAGKPILPGEKQCRYQLPEHRKWAKQEIWAWMERICLGETADMSEYGGGDGHSCDPTKADDWPETRDLSSELLLTILNHEPYRGALTRTGVRIRCASFNETVDLSHMVITHQLWLDDSRFRQAVDLAYVRASSLILLSGSTFDGPFKADGLEVAGNLFMRGGARFKEVRLLGAKVGGNLDASGSTFDGLFNADSLEVAGYLLMRGGARFKEVRLLGAKVGGNLEADDSTFDGLFEADRLEVAGSLFMRDGASFYDINLTGAEIGGHLQLRDSDFKGHLNLTSASIGAELHLTSPRPVKDQKPGVENFPPPRWTKKSRLTLRNTQVGALNDTEYAWDIQPGQLDLTGFTYGRLGGLRATASSAMSARPNEWLLEWLAKQDGFETTYNPQPFEQLAKVLRDSGYPGKAADILFAARDHQRDHRKTPRLTRAKLWVQWGLIGYGYHNWIALLWFAILTGLGMWACGKSALGRRMRRSQRYWYSFDMALPLIELNDRHKAVKLTGGVLAYFYFHKLAGFVLMSFLVAGLSGLTK